MGGDFVTLTRAQIRRIDQLAVEQFGIPSIVLMENAGKNTADWIRGNLARLGRAVVFCGTGNNGGDGFVVARHLHNAGWPVRIFLCGDAARLTADAAANHNIAARMGLAIHAIDSHDPIRAAAASIGDGEVLVDALLGTGFSGAVREPIAGLIRCINAAPAAKIVAVDVPSGLDCDTGHVNNVAISADVTITFVAAKPGLVSDIGRQYAGAVHVVDIGAPPELSDLVRKG